MPENQRGIGASEAEIVGEGDLHVAADGLTADGQPSEIRVRPGSQVPGARILSTPQLKTQVKENPYCATLNGWPAGNTPLAVIQGWASGVTKPPLTSMSSWTALAASAGARG
jgi:hypothetical protein